MTGQITAHFSWEEALASQELPEWTPYRRHLEGGVRYLEFQDSDVRRNIRMVADRLEHMREVLDRPITLTSWYRRADHPEEGPLGGGIHTLGLAVDVVAAPERQYELLVTAWDVGCRRVGIASQFVHLDWLPVELACLARPVPCVWTYAEYMGRAQPQTPENEADRLRGVCRDLERRLKTETERRKLAEQRETVLWKRLGC